MCYWWISFWLSFITQHKFFSTLLNYILYFLVTGWIFHAFKLFSHTLICKLSGSATPTGFVLGVEQLCWWFANAFQNWDSCDGNLSFKIYGTLMTLLIHLRILLVSYNCAKSLLICWSLSIYNNWEALHNLICLIYDHDIDLSLKDMLHSFWRFYFTDKKKFKWNLLQ